MQVLILALVGVSLCAAQLFTVGFLIGQIAPLPGRQALLEIGSAKVVDLRPYDVTSQQLFTNNDIDNDLEMSLAELHLSFEGYDSNFDGVVSREEYTTYTTHQNPAMFVLTHALYDIYDQDANGILTEFDYQALYNIWDANENQVVSEHEFVHWWTTTLTALDHLHHPDATFAPSPNP